MNCQPCLEDRSFLGTLNSHAPASLFGLPHNAVQLGQSLKLQHAQERLRDAAQRRQLEQQQRQEAEAAAAAGRGAGSSSSASVAVAAGSADRPLLDDVSANWVCLAAAWPLAHCCAWIPSS